MGLPDKQVGKSQLRSFRLIVPQKLAQQLPVGQGQGPEIRENRDFSLDFGWIGISHGYFARGGFLINLNFKWPRSGTDISIIGRKFISTILLINRFCCESNLRRRSVAAGKPAPGKTNIRLFFQ
jgi:hypothetical protein